MRRFLATLVLFATFSNSVIAATFTVNNTGDGSDFSAGDAVCEVTSGGGDCTFRAAVEESNALAGADSIEFSGAASVVSTAPYTLSEEVSINTVGNQDVELVGTGVASPSGALNITGAANNVTINNVDVTQFNGIGVRLGGTNGTIQNSTITANSGDGVRIDGITANTVDNNEIGGNTGNGININSGSDGTVTITDNKIGVEDTGSGYNVMNLNGTGGIFSDNSQVDTLTINDNIIGASAEAVRIDAPLDTPDITMNGNYIGLGEDGVTDIQGSGAGDYALRWEDANNVTIQDNVIGNAALGIIMYDSTGIVSLINNLIGLGADGSTVATVENSGIQIYGADEMTIDGNTLGNIDVGQGMFITASDDITVTNNKVGFQTDGNTAAAVSGTGIYVASTDSTGLVEISNNLIGNILTDSGILLIGNPLSAVIENNIIGLEDDGETSAGVGNGADAGIIIHSGLEVLIQGNAIASIFGDGIRLAGGVVVDIFDNTIGTSSDGLSPVGLSGAGIAVSNTDTTELTIGAFNQGNVISTNGGDEGILIEELNSSAATVDIKGNYIGTNLGATAITDYENGNDGIEVKMGEVTIGGDSNFNGELGVGDAIGEGNVISNNGGQGIYISAAAPTDISGVDIYGNLIGAYDPNNNDSFDGEAGNSGSGIRLNGEVNATVNVGSNIISSNDAAGISIESDVTAFNILNNFIGVALNGTNMKANGGASIFASTSVPSITVGSSGGKNTINNADDVGINASALNIFNFANLAAHNICTHPSTIAGLTCVNSVIPPASSAGSGSSVIIIVNNNQTPAEPEPTEPTPTNPLPEEPAPTEPIPTNPTSEETPTTEEPIIEQPLPSEEPPLSEQKPVPTNPLPTPIISPQPVLSTDLGGMISAYETLVVETDIETPKEGELDLTKVILDKFINPDDVDVIRPEVIKLTALSLEEQFKKMPGKSVKWNLGGGKYIELNTMADFEVLFTSDMDALELENLRSLAAENGRQVLEVGYTDVDGDYVNDLIQLSEGVLLFEPDSDNDGFTNSEELFFNSSLKFKTEIPTIARTTNMDGMTVGSKPSIRIMGQSALELEVSLLDASSEMNLNDREEIKLGDVIIDERYKAELTPELEIPNGDYFIILKTKDGRYGDLAKIKVDNTISLQSPVIEVRELEDGTFELIDAANINGIENNDQLLGKADTGVIINISWKSLVLNSTVISDASQGSFSLDIPRDLPNGDHTVVAYAVDPVSRTVSSATKVLISR